MGLWVSNGGAPVWNIIACEGQPSRGLRNFCSTSRVVAGRISRVVVERSAQGHLEAFAETISFIHIFRLEHIEAFRVIIDAASEQQVQQLLFFTLYLLLYLDS